MQLSAIRDRIAFERIGSGAFFFVIGVVLMFFTAGLTKYVDISDMIGFGCIYLSFLLCAFLSLSTAKIKTLEESAASYMVLLVVWTYLVGDDFLFSYNRLNPLNSEVLGDYKSTAYAEAVFWILCAFLLAFISMARVRVLLKSLFSGANKWPTWFALYCVVSIAWSVQPAYSLAWALKLVLVVWMLAFMATWRDPKNLEALLRGTLIILCVAMLISIVKAVVDPADAFKENRLAGVIDPVDTSETGGIALIIAASLAIKTRNRIYLAVAALASVVMILGGGKTATASALVACSLFFLLQKRFKALAIFAISVGLIAVILLTFTPVGDYYSSYASSNSLESLTGRTILWKAAWPEIQAHIWLGHGYMSARFYNLGIPGLAGWEVGQMHNGFLNVLYEEGLPGLFIYLTMVCLTFNNMWKAWETRWEPEIRILIVTFGALFVDLLLAGLLSTCFGGRIYAFHMIFLACVVVSAMLRYGLHRRPLADMSLSS